MSRRMKREWFCRGCDKMHPVTRWIEGSNGAQYWCGHSIKLGLKNRRNDLPPSYQLAAFTSPIVQPICEKVSP
jgi:hypothetical protein